MNDDYHGDPWDNDTGILRATGGAEINIHEWAAQQCGVKLITSLDELECGDFVTGEGGKAHWVRDHWTLDDARCREIVREHFSISTLADYKDGWAAGTHEGMATGKGKTIAEAEISCIKAIREAQK